MRGARGGAPRRRPVRPQVGDRSRKAGRIGGDRLGRCEHSAQFARVRIHMDQLLLGQRTRDDRIALGRRFAEPGADRQQQVGAVHTCAQFVGHAPADMPGEVRMVPIEAFEAAPCDAHRQVEAFGESLQLRRGLRGPAAAAHHHERAFRGFDQFAHARDVLRSGMAVHARVTRQVGHRGLAPQRVLGGPAPPDRGGRWSPRKTRGQCIRESGRCDRSARPICSSARTYGGNRFPGTLRARRSRC